MVSTIEIVLRKLMLKQCVTVRRRFNRELMYAEIFILLIHTLELDYYN